MEGKRIVLLMYVMAMLFSAGKSDISITESGEGVKLTCNQPKWDKDGKFYDNKTDIELEYKDENSGQYTCNTQAGQDVHVYVKFRTCDNCVALDAATVAGLIVGEVIATALIGVAVYFLASQPQGKVYKANKASDRQVLIQNQQNDSTYQPLSHGNASEYSQLEPRRGRKH